MWVCAVVAEDGGGGEDDTDRPHEEANGKVFSTAVAVVPGRLVGVVLSTGNEGEAIGSIGGEPLPAVLPADEDVSSFSSSSGGGGGGGVWDSTAATGLSYVFFPTVGDKGKEGSVRGWAASPSACRGRFWPPAAPFRLEGLSSGGVGGGPASPFVAVVDDGGGKKEESGREGVGVFNDTLRMR